MPVRVIPVLDVKQGQAVHAVGGDRAQYRPLTSVLHQGADPVDLALALHEQLACRQLYLADLDAIGGQAPNLPLYGRLAEIGLELWVDAGLTDLASVLPLIEAQVPTIVAGLETVRGSEALRAMLERVGPDRLVFSLDLRAGRPLVARQTSWRRPDGESIAREVLDLGVRRLLLLDLARVGQGQGIGTEPLLRRLALGCPEAELIVGGGIASAAELRELEKAGAAAVLVGSALHDGRIGRRELASIHDAAEGSPHNELNA